ncbi:universal stress protein [Candidatus Spyradosoma sp. SGI.093]|uniref:universal stress protein n=1 Tax=Candidatus Spyradosoma sp. SGI.093 TaxID=3420583 RepID=UPI003CFDFF3F
MNNILVCVDGSSYGQVCTAYAVWLSKQTGMRVSALYVSELWQYETPLVADFGGALGTQPYMGLTAQLREIEAGKAKVIENYVRGEFAKAGIPDRVDFYHRSGILVDCIDEFETQRKDIGVIVLGKRGENANFAKGHLGSNMERVIRSTKRPCFVVNRKFIEQKKIVLAYDGSPSATRALEYLATNKEFITQDVHIVTVAKPGAEADATRLLFSAEARLKGGPITPVTQVLSGAPGEALEKYVEENGITCLIMGAYGHSRVRQFIIGSTTTELVRRCLVPVIMFR